MFYENICLTGKRRYGLRSRPWTIMMSLFDEEQIMKSFIKSERHEAVQESARETAKKLIKKGKMSFDEIADCVPSLSLDELRELEAEVIQLA